MDKLAHRPAPATQVSSTTPRTPWLGTDSIAAPNARH